MDFSKIKPAVEEITLSDSQKEDILNACRGKKRKFNYKPLAAVAAAAAIVIVLVSPGFLFRASAPGDSAAQESADDIYYSYSADNKSDSGDVFVNNSSSTVETPLFEADGFADIYAIIPNEFSSLADPAEFEGWKTTLSSEGGMAMMQFVEHFGIAREDFDSANSAYAARIAYNDAYTFDADIIYSFDKDLIDSYYCK